jgi:hypothetical protein
MSSGCPRPREELGQNQRAYCQEGHWKNECSQQFRDSQKDHHTRGRGHVVVGKYQPTSGEPANIVCLAVLEDYEEG